MLDIENTPHLILMLPLPITHPLKNMTDIKNRHHKRHIHHSHHNRQQQVPTRHTGNKKTSSRPLQQSRSRRYIACCDGPETAGSEGEAEDCCRENYDEDGVCAEGANEEDYGEETHEEEVETCWC